jgi:hypothetical protein
MNKYKTGILLMVLAAAITALSGCASPGVETGNVMKKGDPDAEPAWIRNGEPLEFEGELWYPQDGIEIFIDSEMFLVGEFRDIKLFVERADVRPYSRIYTRFGKNKFRYFKRYNGDDKG